MENARVEEYTVLVEIDNETGFRISERWLRDGQLHRQFGPAHRTFDETTGRLESERWMIDDSAHRDGDNPYETVWDVDTGRVKSEVYMVRGMLHRDGDKPAQVTYDGDNGRIVREEYWKGNRRHRDVGAAIIVRDSETGDVLWQQYYKSGYQLSVPGASLDSP